MPSPSEENKPSVRFFVGLVLVAALGLSAGVAIALGPRGSEPVAEPIATQVVEVEAAVAEPEVRIPPDWQQSTSTAEFSRCKLLDPRPKSVRDLHRGQTRDGVIGRENVGFPRTEREIPGLGVGNVILAKVAFEDAPPSSRLRDDFLETHAAFMTEWSEFFSQGKFRWEFQVVEGWVNVPIDHADYGVDPRAADNEFDQEAFWEANRLTMRSLIRQVVEQLPRDLDYSSAHAAILYWTPEMYAFVQPVSDRSAVFQTPQGPQRFSVQGGGVYHTTDSGNLTFDMKRDFAWSYFLHELMHWQGMNGHAPGNGWKTGIGQGSYPNGRGEYSGVITAWETFLFEWYEDSQVHCADIDTLVEPERVMLTPLEIYGGERKMIAVRLEDYRVLVVESRRPIGYSQWWAPESSGLLVYEVDANGIHTDHVPHDCGNDRSAPKWAYYLYPDEASNQVCVPDDVSGILVKEGMSVTYGGVKISLEFSEDELDYVLIAKTND